MKTKRTSKVSPSKAYPSMPTGMVLPSASFTSGEIRTASFGNAASTSSGVIPKRAARHPGVGPGSAREGRGGRQEGGEEEGAEEGGAHALQSNGTSDIITLP